MRALFVLDVDVVEAVGNGMSANVHSENGPLSILVAAATRTATLASEAAIKVHEKRFGAIMETLATIAATNDRSKQRGVLDEDVNRAYSTM